MIAFLKGNIAEIRESSVVLEAGPIGFQVFVTARDAQNLGNCREEVKLYTHFQVREDAMQLFGFLHREDLQVFQLLLGVNGIGPKAALGILSVFSANELRFAVLAGDAKTISRAPGIGNKTAQKMILELKDKFDLQETFDRASGQPEAVQTAAADNTQEAVEALVALGYPGAEALRAVRGVGAGVDMTTEDILKAALKKMAF